MVRKQVCVQDRRQEEKAKAIYITPVWLITLVFAVFLSVCAGEQICGCFFL